MNWARSGREMVFKVNMAAAYGLSVTKKAAR